MKIFKWIWQIDSDTKFMIIMGLIMTFLINMLAGAENGWGNNCKYTNILSRINLGYIAGCELAKPRWNLEK